MISYSCLTCQTEYESEDKDGKILKEIKENYYMTTCGACEQEWNVEDEI